MMKFKLLTIALLAIFLWACGPTLPDPDAEDSTTVDAGSADEGYGATDVYEEPDAGAGEFFEEALAMVIYFDFDQSDISAQDKAMLARHANQMANDSRRSVRLEGHADERGSREYNIGLGERRSQAVRKLLLIQGAAVSQISTVSFGEERPAVFGSDEASYAQNRRVEIKYAN